MAEQRYRVAVYFRGDDDLDHGAGIWEGVAANRDDAERQALDEYSDLRIDGWFVEFLDIDDDDEEEE